MYLSTNQAITINDFGDIVALNFLLFAGYIIVTMVVTIIFLKWKGDPYITEKAQKWSAILLVGMAVLMCIFPSVEIWFVLNCAIGVFIGSFIA
jgi:NADH:ubiquinone oxidoreductase subunit 6 (subunit J)